MNTVPTLPFGVLLKRHRRAAGLTQEVLAERAGYSAIYIRMLERGARTPLPSTVALLAEALSLPDEERSQFAAAAGRRRADDFDQDQTAESQMPFGSFLGALPTNPLVARDAELGRIVFALDAVLGGAGRLVLLAGEPGVGKTRLAQEVMLAARKRGCLVATGRCYEMEQAVAHYPCLEALASACAAAPLAVQTSVPRRWPELAALLPDHGVASAQPASTNSSIVRDQSEQMRLFVTIIGFLRTLAQERPVVLLLDDLHWADSASLAFLVHLALHTRNARVLLMGTYREAEAHLNRPLEAALRELVREQLVERVALAPFTQTGTAALLASRLDGGEVSPELASAIYERAEGNPFFTQELLRALVERGDIYHQEGRWVLRASDELTVPETVRLVVGDRVARLSQPTQCILREASVLGQTFVFDELKSVSASTEDEVENALEEGAGAGLLRETGLDGYSFSHALIQQALYAELAARRKVRLHRTAGEAMERLPESVRIRRVAELAYHFARSDRQDKALTYLVRAAERASTSSAYHEEAALLGQAIEAALRSGQPQECVTDLRLRRGKALRIISQWPEAERELEAARATLAPTQTQERIQVLLDLAEVQHWLHGPADIRRYAGEALSLSERLGRDDLAAQAMCRLALADSSEGAVHSAIRRYDGAFRRAGNEHLGALVTGVEYSGLNLYWVGEYAAAVERSRSALVLARQEHETTYAARALANLGLALTGSGQYEEALRTFAEARQFARERRTGQWLARSTAMSGGLHLEIWDFDGAESLAEEARALGLSLNWPQAVASAGIDLLLNFARRRDVGRTEALLPDIAQAAARAHSEHGWLWRLRLAQARAEIALARGAWEDAIRWADDAIAQARQHGRVKYEVAGLQVRGQALAACGQTHKALLSLRRALDRARPVGDPAMLLRAAAALLVVDGTDQLLAEARMARDRIVAALPDEELIRRFMSASQVQQLG